MRKTTAVLATAFLALGMVGLGTSRAQAEAKPPVLTWALAQYDFGSVSVGQTPSETFTLSNTGGKSTGNIVITQSGSTAFIITADSCTDKALGPNKSCSVTVEYDPTNTSGDTGMLVATAEYGVASMKLFGNGTPDLVLSPGTLEGTAVGVNSYSYNFGSFSAGDGATQTFTVSNTGTGTSKILQIVAINGASAAGFSLSNDKCSGIGLAPGGACKFALTYTSPDACSPFNTNTGLVTVDESGTSYAYITLSVEGECQ